MADNEERKNEQTSSETTGSGKHSQAENDDLLHKFYMFGLGLRKEIEETMTKLSDRGKPETGTNTDTNTKDRTFDDMLKKAREQTSVLEGKMDELVKKGLDRMNVVTKERFEALEKRVEELEKRMMY
jgi:polyhydroxyalkanoate synthesis regulator phasin